MLLPAISSPSDVLATPPVCTMSLMLQIPLLRAEKLCDLPAPCSPGSQLEEGYSPSHFSMALLSDGKQGTLKGAKRSGTLFPSRGLYFYLKDSKRRGFGR